MLSRQMSVSSQAPFRHLGVLFPADAITHNLPFPTIDHCNPMTPPGIRAKKVGHSRCPPLMGTFRHRGFLLNTRPHDSMALRHGPTMAPNDSLGLFLGDHQAHKPTKHNGDPSIAIAGITPNKVLDGLFHLPINPRRLAPSRLLVHRRPTNPHPLSDLAPTHFMALGL
ncbi:hypothetical protein EDC27_1400 [Desulfosoma caldarium]|uniref:Uncharacterized protein n=1 Tax=Desulfosoma caldarium TaxID=610254 RepID=A0A3N1UQJ9_9BACT|nr:hypothetical protein EDC27_1400 [Desulfosoma caldarium]